MRIIAFILALFTAVTASGQGSSIAVYTAQIQLFSKFASYGVKVEI